MSLLSLVPEARIVTEINKFFLTRHLLTIYSVRLVSVPFFFEQFPEFDPHPV